MNRNRTPNEKRKIRRTVYALCAAAGTLSSLLIPSATGAGILLPAVEQLEKTDTAKTPTADDFVDVAVESWYYPYVDSLVKNGTVVGTSAETFSPSDRFTTAEAATVVTRYLGLENYAETRLAESGSAYWYAGFIGTMVDAGIIRDGEFGVSVASDGTFSIAAPDECVRPLKRYEFARLISRSFEMSGNTVESRRIPSELSPDGSSFIVGGRYDGTVSRYAAEINDYEAIPEAYREDVLKAYYNGIFNGDENGNFNPNDELLRCEMAKVVSVILDSSARKRTEYRELFAKAFELSNHTVIDGWKNHVLDRTFAYEFLSAYADRLAIASSGSYNSIAYTPLSAPSGYLIEVRVYSSDSFDGVYRQIDCRLPSDSEALTADGTNLRVLFVLRNADNAQIEGACRVDIASDGTTARNDLFKAVL